MERKEQLPSKAEEACHLAFVCVCVCAARSFQETLDEDGFSSQTIPQGSWRGDSDEETVSMYVVLSMGSKTLEQN